MKKVLFMCVCLLLLAFSAFSVSAEEERQSYTISCINGDYILTSDEDELMHDRSIVPLLNFTGLNKVYLDNVRIYEHIKLENVNLVLSGNIFCDSGAVITVGDGADIVFSDLHADMLGADSFIKVERGTLCILNDSSILSPGYDIESDRAISFIKGKERYTGADIFNVRYKGNIQRLADAAIFDTVNPPVLVYSEDGREIPIHRVTYINELADSLISYAYALNGEALILPDSVGVDGYDFCGWSIEGLGLGENLTVTSAVTLYADYRLSPPEFSISDKNMKYDGKIHSVGIEDVTHPLMEDGTVSCKWYRGGDLVSEDEQLLVRNVSDSGEYSVEVTFLHKNGTTASKISGIKVNISPITLGLIYKDDNFVIETGNVMQGDKVDIIEIKEGGMLYAKTENSNYCLDFLPENIKNNDMLVQILAWTLILLAVFVAVAYYIFWSVETDLSISSVRSFTPSLSEDKYVIARDEDGSLREYFFGIDRMKADELLSDSLAKNLIIKGGKTDAYGKERAEISLGEVNDNFYAGDTVDLKDLKKRGIISEGTSFVKITAEGRLDKPLKIVADAFEITAVKMIVLSGGEAVKVKRHRKQ